VPSKAVSSQDASGDEAPDTVAMALARQRFLASLLDYTVEEASGQVVEGSRSEPVKFEEYWTFARPVGPNPWRLSAIQQA
jgi:predicted lipid-binding transport protein (Tim44 family)